MRHSFLAGQFILEAASALHLPQSHTHECATPQSPRGSASVPKSARYLATMAAEAASAPDSRSKDVIVLFDVDGTLTVPRKVRACCCGWDMPRRRAVKTPRH